VQRYVCCQYVLPYRDFQPRFTQHVSMLLRYVGNLNVQICCGLRYNLNIVYLTKIVTFLSRRLNNTDTVPAFDQVSFICLKTRSKTPVVNCMIVVTESDDTAMVFGERLDLVNVSRYCADIYECSASNNIPPAVKRHIKLTVECTYCICSRPIHDSQRTSMLPLSFLPPISDLHHRGAAPVSSMSEVGS